MTPTTHNSDIRSRARRGQSIIIALLVLLLLGIAGGLFVTIIARNLISARRSARTGAADAYARAGLTFADARLTGSLDGADWRPPLQAQLDPAYQPTAGTREAARYQAAVSAGLAAANADDPDFKYLTAGFARYNTGAGRFLLRVTYDPINAFNTTSALPPGKYLKIESIGREGVIDALDPTTYNNNRTTDRLQSYQVAYKPIGITDFARFETNPDKRSDIANLGVISQYSNDDPDGAISTPGVYDFNNAGGNAPTLKTYPVLTTYGAADAYLKDGAGNAYPNPNAGTGTPSPPTGYTTAPGGGSLQSNMSARFFGKNVFYLNNAGANAPLLQDGVGVAGDVLFDNYDPTAPLTQGQRASVLLNPTDLTQSSTTGSPAYPSVDPKFSTFAGLFRDGGSGNDAAGLPRSVARVEPPAVDAQDPATQLPRFQALAMTSAPRGTFPAGSARYGYGRDIYVDNAADIQSDSQSVGGGSTLTDEWLHGAANAANGGIGKGGWVGQLYSPKGVSITLGVVTGTSGSGATATNTYGIRLTRDAEAGNWKNPDGTAGTSATLLIPYSDLVSSTNPDNDIVISAEGNVRVRGVLSPNEGTAQSPSYTARHITIASGGTAYIEGNLLKGTPDSSISVLAHDYVCVNTTQFLAGPQPDDANPFLPTPDATTGHYELTPEATLTPLLQEIGFLSGGTLTANYPAGTALYVSGTSSTFATDGTTAVADFSFNLNGASPFPVTFGPDPNAALPERQTVLLPPPTTNNTTQMSVSRDVNSQGDPQIERLAVLPMDIRIEAVLFAQTRSFFVIPGDWFNTDSADTLAIYNSPTPTRTANSDPRFPFYGQPIDLKITVYGSVSEARPADIAAQTEWMRKWGWIPQYHGNQMSNGGIGVRGPELAGHRLTSGARSLPALGLQIIYDPQAGYPYHLKQTNADTSYYLRSDTFGRPLPFAPNLPVSAGLLYSGESGEPPLLQ